ncbi:hypothetical protein [Enterococcus massiliensis]|uniref:hypothetical protein n=1 Tax=Enterococcus massiliensis TaxID=1640685 RepID=UPI00065DFF0D|nr:hypothetical protein [Enterococcus massiliensis]
MTSNKTPESQLRANREYRKRVGSDEEKREHRNYMTGRRSARSFINNRATIDDLEELEQLIAERKKALR